ncbi:MAG: cobalamin-dependent protein [Acidobacteriota bacterium]|nr:cobalamin-dependent protein [Acidobacteriota bacterium]
MSVDGTVSKQNEAIGRLIDSNRARLAEAVTVRQYEAQPELAARYGEAGRAKCLQDANYHLSYLADAVAASSLSLFSDYIGWAKVMLNTRGIPAQDLSRNLIIMREVVLNMLPAEMGRVVGEYFEAGLNMLPSMPTELAPLFDEGAPHADLAKQFLRLLLDGDRHIASRLILNAVDSGLSVKDIYLHVFQPSQREIGRLWQMNQVSVAQEHYCTAATQLIMAQLYPRIFRTEKNGRRVVATSTAGELHEIGVRIITDFLEMEGWDTYYLGANSPTVAILQAIAERKADVLAVSATMTFHIRAVENLISAVRSSESLNTVKILVGGYPFNVEPELWKRVGADAYAADASEVIAACSRLNLC